MLSSSLFLLLTKILPNGLPFTVLQATAEQIRLAQMIYDKNDADFEDKVNQVRNAFGMCQAIQGSLSVC